jgi:hypothetical protein
MGVLRNPERMPKEGFVFHPRFQKNNKEIKEGSTFSAKHQQNLSQP